METMPPKLLIVVYKASIFIFDELFSCCFYCATFFWHFTAYFMSMWEKKQTLNQSKSSSFQGWTLWLFERFKIPRFSVSCTILILLHLDQWRNRKKKGINYIKNLFSGWVMSVSWWCNMPAQQSLWKEYIYIIFFNLTGSLTHQQFIYYSHTMQPNLKYSF